MSEKPIHTGDLQGRFPSHIVFSRAAHQIYLVTLRPTQLTQASFLQKKSNVAKCFFDICNAEMAQWRRKS